MTKRQLTCNFGISRHNVLSVGLEADVVGFDPPEEVPVLVPDVGLDPDVAGFVPEEAGFVPAAVAGLVPPLPLPDGGLVPLPTTQFSS